MAVNKDKPLNEAIQELTQQLTRMEAKQAKSKGTDFRQALDNVNVETFFPSLLSPIGRGGQKTANAIQGIANLGRGRKINSLRSQIDSMQGELTSSGSLDAVLDDVGGSDVGGGLGMESLIEVVEGVVLSIENMSESMTDQLDMVKYCLEDISEVVHDIFGVTQEILGPKNRESREVTEMRRESDREKRGKSSFKSLPKMNMIPDTGGGMMGGLGSLLGIGGMTGLVPTVAKIAVIAAGLTAYFAYHDVMVEGIANFLVGNEKGRKAEEEFLKKEKAFFEQQKSFFDVQVEQYTEEQKLNVESDTAEIREAGQDKPGLDRVTVQQRRARSMVFSGEIPELATLTNQTTSTASTVSRIEGQRKQNEANAADTRGGRIMNMIGSGLMTATGLGYLFGGSPDEDFARQYNAYENTGIFSDESLEKAIQNANDAVSLEILARYVDQDNDDSLNDTELSLLQSFMEKGIHLAPPTQLAESLKNLGGSRIGGTELVPDIDAGGALSTPENLLRDLQSGGFSLPSSSSTTNPSLSPTQTERNLGQSTGGRMSDLFKVPTPITQITNVTLDNSTPMSAHFQGTPVDYSDGILYR